MWWFQGFWAMAEIMSPFNVWQYIAVLKLLTPAAIDAASTIALPSQN